MQRRQEAITPPFPSNSTINGQEKGASGQAKGEGVRAASEKQQEKGEEMDSSCLVPQLLE